MYKNIVYIFSHSSKLRNNMPFKKNSHKIEKQYCQSMFWLKRIIKKLWWNEWICSQAVETMLLITSWFLGLLTLWCEILCHPSTKKPYYSEQPTKCRTKIGLGGYEHCLYVWVLHPRIMSQILTVKYGAGWLMLGVFCGCWFRSSCKDSDMCQDILVQNLVASASRLRFVCTSILYPSSNRWQKLIINLNQQWNCTQ